MADSGRAAFDRRPALSFHGALAQSTSRRSASRPSGYGGILKSTRIGVLGAAILLVAGGLLCAPIEIVPATPRWQEAQLAEIRKTLAAASALAKTPYNPGEGAIRALCDLGTEALVHLFPTALLRIPSPLAS